MQNQGAKKTITVTFCGAPNVGKSTLLNKILGRKITICSPKPQTTRNNIRGIIVKNNTQIVIIDTPGIFKPKSSQLEKQIVKEAWSGFCGSDLICLIIDAKKGINKSTTEILKKILLNKIPIVAVINKSDLLTMNEKFSLADKLNNMNNFVDIFSLSAKTGRGCDDLLKYFIKSAHNGIWQYHEDELTDKSGEFIASEFVREQLFIILSKELPYMLSCETDFFQNNDESMFISVVVSIKKENHKKIILGSNGDKLKKIIHNASVELERLFGKHVELKIFVKLDKRF